MSAGPATSETALQDQAPGDTWSFTPPYSPRLTEFMSAGWGPSTAPELGPTPPAALLAERRERLRDRIGPSLPAVIAAGVVQYRNSDQPNPFRPSADYAWTTGDQQPGGVLVLDPTSAAGDRLYVPAPLPRDDPRFYTDAHTSEVWVGPTPTLADREARLGIEVRPLTELAPVLDALGAACVSGGADSAIAGIRRQRTSEGIELAAVLAELRMIKDGWELDQLRQAVDATVTGFEAVRDALLSRTEIGEREIEAAFAACARQLGNYPGFPTIVGGGRHATTLHWTRNDGTLRAGELVLLDAGIEIQSLYTGDLTRTLPFGGGFTALQRQVYDHVQAAEEAAFAELAPGKDFRAYYGAVERTLVHGLADLGVLPVSESESLDPDCGLHRRWTLCAPGHHLGLDVHDCGDATEAAYIAAELRPGMVITIEPGLYFQANDELVPEGLRGIGVRVEDDVLITETGYELLSQRLPRRADEVQAWVQG